MAGVSDKPYRTVVREMGAGLAISEMLTSQSNLHHTYKSQHRMNICNEQAPVSVQLVGTEPKLLAEAACINVENGADIIDINMGCPAKKVCKKLAGSALLGDQQLVENILRSVVDAVAVPVTLKIRTGLTPEERNAKEIARIAEDCGVQALTVHGRTRQCKFVGEVEYDSIAEVKKIVSIPVIANGDIDSPEKAAYVLQYTTADAVMIGRAAQGRPWLFQQIVAYLETGKLIDEPNWADKKQIIWRHIKAIHSFYGDAMGLKFARKHIAWYLDKLFLAPILSTVLDLRTERSLINQQQSINEQLEALQLVFVKIDNYFALNESSLHSCKPEAA